MAQRSPRGVGAALLTIFGEDGALHAEQTAAHAADLAGRGVDWFLILGTSGEGHCLSQAERSQLIKSVRRELGPRAAVYVGVRSDGLFSARGQALQARDEGAVGVIAMAPVTGVERYYAELRDVLREQELIGYHLPGPWGGRLAIELMPKLGIDAVKDASSDGNRMLRTLAYTDLPILVGLGLLPMARNCGAAGAALAIANLVPELCAEVFYSPNPTNVAELAREAESARGSFPRVMKEKLARLRQIPATCRETS